MSELNREELLANLDEQIEIQKGQLSEELSKGEEAEQDCIDSDRYYIKFYTQLRKIVAHNMCDGCRKDLEWNEHKYCGTCFSRKQSPVVQMDNMDTPDSDMVAFHDFEVKNDTDTKKQYTCAKCGTEVVLDPYYLEHLCLNCMEYPTNIVRPDSDNPYPIGHDEFGEVKVHGKNPDTPVEVDEPYVVDCPSCGKEWDMGKHSACQCGAILQRQPVEVDE